MAEIEVFRARNTTGLAVNNTRVTKAKPYGLIQTIQKFDVDDEEIIKALEADVQPVRRGQWKALMMSEETGWDLSLTGGRDEVCEYVCSVCKKPAIIDEFGEIFLPDFCPNCGADMRGDTE